MVSSELSTRPDVKPSLIEVSMRWWEVFFFFALLFLFENLFHHGVSFAENNNESSIKSGQNVSEKTEQNTVENKKFNLGLRLDFEYYDDGLTSERQRTKAGSFFLSALNLGYQGFIRDPKVFLSMRFSLLSNETLEWGYMSYFISKTTHLSFGKMLINQGGWYAKEVDFWNFAKSIYESKFLPFEKYSPAASASFNIAGQISLQLTNDVIIESTNPAYTYWNKANKQPAMTVEWIGAFGPIQPLIQLGTYDFSHSKFFVLGAKAEMGPFSSSIDYAQDLRSAKVQENEKPKDVQGIIQSWTFDSSYEIESTLKVGFFLSSFDYRQPEDKAINQNIINQKGNSESTLMNGGDTPFDDNGLVWSVYTYFLSFKKGWQPFLSLVGRSGRWLSESGAAENKGDLKFSTGIIGRL